MMLPKSPFPFSASGLTTSRRLRVHENYDAEFLRLGPERVKSGTRQILAHHMTADGGATRSQFFDGMAPAAQPPDREIAARPRKGRRSDRNGPCTIRKLLCESMFTILLASSRLPQGPFRSLRRPFLGRAAISRSGG